MSEKTKEPFERIVTEGMSIIRMKDIPKQICPLCSRNAQVAWRYITCQCKDKVHKTCLACLELVKAKVGMKLTDDMCYKDTCLALLTKKGIQ